MSVQIQCSKCGTIYSVFEQTVGRRVRCPECHAMVEATLYLPPANLGKGSIASKVLDLAEAQGLLDGKAIAELRKKVAESKFIVTPEAVAKVLVDHGHLTPFQARKLVAQALPDADTPLRPQPGLKKVVPPKESPPEPPSKAPPTKRLPETVEMTLAEDDEERTPGPSDDEIIDLEAVEPKPMPVHRGPAWKTDPATAGHADDEIVALEPLESLVPLEEIAPSQPVIPRPSPAAFTAPRSVAPVPAAGPPTKNVWDSPLLLIGGSIMGVTLVAFLILLYALTRGTAAELLRQADAEYEQGAYTSAIARYERFLDKYPDNPEASKAHVFQGMAQIRQVSDDGKNPRLALQTTREVLPQIEKEEQFHQARNELSTILPDIADGFATLAAQAEETLQKEELLKLASEAMELVNNPSYLPASLRKEREQRISRVLDKLQVAQRSIDQDKELAASLEKIQAAAAKGDAAGAYQVRGQLLRTYPGLEANPQLVAAIRNVGEKERELVQVTQPDKAAATDDRPTATSTVVLADRQGPDTGEAAPQAIFTVVEGAAYAFDVASGRVLWRRHIGYESLLPPMSLKSEAGADALLVDAHRRELVRVQGTTGKLVWRQSFEEAIAGCTLIDDRIVVTTRRGKLAQVDAASGKIASVAQLPQGATVAAAVDARPGRASRLIQLGEHSTLFVLAADSLVCSETVYLAHKAGAIFVPPVAVFDHVLVCESPDDSHSLIRVLAPDAKTKALAPVGRPMRLKGRIVTPPAISGRRVAAMTDLGQIAVYEVDAASTQAPLRLIAGVEASETGPLPPYYALAGNNLWTATRRRTLLEVQAAVQQFTRKWTEDQGDSFVAPLQSHDDKLVYARRDPGGSAVLVEACNALTGKVLWTTRLASPIIALAANQSRDSVDALTQEGKLFSLNDQRRNAPIVDKPTFTPAFASGRSILPNAKLQGDGKTLVWTEAQAGGRIFTYQIDSGGSPVATPLPASDAQAAASASPMAGRLLLPLTNGSIVLLTEGSGKPAASPFLPPLVPGALPQWKGPAVQADGKGFKISDGRGTVYSVALKEASQAQLVESGHAATPAPVISSLVLASGAAFGLMRSESGDSLVGLEGDAALTLTTTPLEGRCQAGPFVVGGLVFVAAEPDGLVCCESQGKLRWRQPLAHGPLAGSPMLLPVGDLLVNYQSGIICRVDAATGKELSATDLGQPLGGAACILGADLFLAGSDGVLHRTPVPARP